MTEFREVERRDLPACAAAMYEAFRDIAQRHDFPPDFPSPDAAEGLLGMMLETPGFRALVAEEDEQVLGSIFVSLRSPIGGISVVTVDPRVQNRRVGRQLMERGMQLLAQHGHARQQLVQAAYHNRSLCLYAKLGFAATEMLSNMTGDGIAARVSGRAVRAAESVDVQACNALCRKVHGFDRAGELANAIAQGTASVVEYDGRITGYTTGVGFTGHGVGESNDDLKALIASVDALDGPGILIPTANGELFRWCLDHGLRLVQQMTLMDTVPSGAPNGVHWPAVLC